PGNPNVVYAATNENGLYRTEDGGGSWSPIDAGIPVDRYVRIVIDPRTPATIYAARANQGIYRSTNRGDAWTEITHGVPGQASGIAIDHQLSNVLYAAVDGYGVYKSTDTGASWHPMSSGITDALVYDITIDPVAFETLYLATFAD